ncbi:hypothetical protein AVEN_194410-1 [Araneus ventricosus]|uniref:CCHC-type domain-containing protein n=1 Tax=Araneus ventricosus TaxID=182803 RepID=A0A4Y2A652_ARAVE|nr:hypothetical protein AVEN_194410-1 [Araneus ventricosus]
MGKRKSGPFSGQQIASNSSSSNFHTFFLIKRVSTSDESFHSVSPFLVEKAITGSIGDVKSTKKLRSGDLLVEVQSRKQSEQILKLKKISNIPITVSPHASLNSSKGVITCGELLNVPTEEILKELQCQRGIYTQPTPLFQVPTFRTFENSYRGTLTCARCAEVGHDSSQCTATEKCVNCKDAHTSFSRDCSAWKLEKEIITTKIKKRISYPEARKLVKSMAPTLGNSYVSVAKKSASAPSADRNKDILTVSISKPSDSFTRASPPITNSPFPSTPPVALVSEEALASPDFTLVINKKKLKKDSPTKTNNTIAKAEKIAKFYTTSHLEVTNPIPTKDNISTHQSALKPFPTTKPTSVDIEILPMAVRPPLELCLAQYGQVGSCAIKPESTNQPTLHWKKNFTIS